MVRAKPGVVKFRGRVPFVNCGFDRRHGPDTLMAAAGEPRPIR
jgi:hypothetical protein